MVNGMKYFIISGEASGDMHAAALITELRTAHPDAEFVGLGGDRMAAAGCRLVQHYREMAYMGIVAVVRHLDKVVHNLRLTRRALLQEQPDVVIYVDYPTFNLRIARYVRAHLPHARTYYYIPPKVWAWKRWRIHRIARLVDEVWGIFPFEPAFYARYGYTCRYVGNPTARALAAWRENNHQSSIINHQSSIIALLPGSRLSEIHHCLPRMLEAARRFPDYRIVVAAAPGVDDEEYAPYLHEGETLTRDTYTLLTEARAAVVNSGTATLEAALLSCPEVAVYHVACAGLMKHIWHALFEIRNFTLVNIIANSGTDHRVQLDHNGVDREVIRELIAHLFTVDNVAAELDRLLHDEPYRERMLSDFDALREVLDSSCQIPV